METSPPASSPPNPAAEPAPRVNPVTVWFLIGVIVVSMVVGYNILVFMFRPKPVGARLEAFTVAVEERKLETELGDFLKSGKHNPELDELIKSQRLEEEIQKNPDLLAQWVQRKRLPYLSRLEQNITLVERSGKTVELKELKGKIIVACWVYTHCPRGCAGVVGELIQLHKDMADVPEVHFLSVSVDPADTPEQLSKFTESFNIKGDKWWFVNGLKDEIRVYMTRYFGFQAVQEVPEADRLSPDDKFLHDMKVALVDKKGHVRGHYDIASPDPEFAKFWKEKIRTDIKTLLKEPNLDP